MALSKYGDISEETGVMIAGEFLERAKVNMVTSLFAQTKPMPKNKSQKQKFRRYEYPWGSTPKPLLEGVTPKAGKVKITDIYVDITQYGDLLELTDVVEDTHEDPVLREFSGLLGESASEMLENIRIAHLLSGTNVMFANGSYRSDVNTKVTKVMLRKIVKFLKIARASRITKMLKSSNAYGTVSVKPAFIGLVHPAMTPDIQDLAGFKSVEDYSGISPYINEIGAIEDIRFIEQNLLLPYEDAGGAVSTGLASTSGTKCDVYPFLVLGANAYADVPLKGYRMQNADNKGEMVVPVEILVQQPNKPSKSDPLGQRGSVGYKTWGATVILQDLHIVRGEAAVSE